QKATFETKISTLDEYSYEYCNFGCAYFVLKRIRK
ncbi:YutD-like domain-containing protein, partial [Priestia megaterium]